jgi:ABC-type nitrate/sulfonate/bicarbonate transport system ATPase subunit
VVLADRILVMSACPGRIIDDIPVSIGRPRAEDVMFLPEFNGSSDAASSTSGVKARMHSRCCNRLE